MLEAHGCVFNHVVPPRGQHETEILSQSRRYEPSVILASILGQGVRILEGYATGDRTEFALPGESGRIRAVRV